MADIHTPPPLAGILETALYVQRLDDARDFYTRVMGLSAIHEDERMTAYDVAAHSVLLLFQEGGSLDAVELPRGSIPPHDGRGPVHVAFAVQWAALPRWEAHLAQAGVAVESTAEWPRGGRSIYFRDPDGHLLELVTPGLWPGF